MFNFFLLNTGIWNTLVMQRVSWLSNSRHLIDFTCVGWCFAVSSALQWSFMNRCFYWNRLKDYSVKEYWIIILLSYIADLMLPYCFISLSECGILFRCHLFRCCNFQKWWQWLWLFYRSVSAVAMHLIHTHQYDRQTSSSIATTFASLL